MRSAGVSCGPIARYCLLLQWVRLIHVITGEYRGVVAAQPVRSWTVEEFFGDAGPPTDDDVPIALDGRVLDTPAKVIAFIDEINARRVAADHGA